MPTILLRIENIDNIYQEVARNLYPYRTSEMGSVLFIVEGTEEERIVGLRYPGRKVSRRELVRPNRNSNLWSNLYDFEVVPFENNEEIPTANFTWDRILVDFKDNKSLDNIFWGQIKEIHDNNNISTGIPPELPGINSRLFLIMLKWLWIQEDFNYKLRWQDLELPETEKYCLTTRTGSITSGGAGRTKFFAAMTLIRNGFTYEIVKKIIPLY